MNMKYRILICIRQKANRFETMKYLPIIFILLFSCEKYEQAELISYEFTDERDGRTYKYVDIGHRPGWLKT